MVAIACAAVTVAPPAESYERVVHLDATARVIELWGLELTVRQRNWVGFCSELPDEAEELSATSLYTSVMWPPTRWYRWGWGDQTHEPETQAMVKVQRLLHGLTGGSIDNLAKARNETIGELVGLAKDATEPRDKLERLCALGFGIHLLGDSYAHRNLSEPTKMYITGQGHARHGTRPDRILRLGRASDVALLGAFTKNLATFGAAAFEDPWSQVAWLDRGKSIDDLAKSVGQSDANEEARRLAEHDTWSALDGQKLSPSKHSVEPCQNYLDDLFANQEAIDSLLPSAADPSLSNEEGNTGRHSDFPRCRCVWGRYAEVAAKKFHQRSVGEPDFGNLQGFEDPFKQVELCKE